MRLPSCQNYNSPTQHHYTIFRSYQSPPFSRKAALCLLPLFQLDSFCESRLYLTVSPATFYTCALPTVTHKRCRGRPPTFCLHPSHRPLYLSKLDLAKIFNTITCSLCPPPFYILLHFIFSNCLSFLSSSSSAHFLIKPYPKVLENLHILHLVFAIDTPPSTATCCPPQLLSY